MLQNERNMQNKLAKTQLFSGIESSRIEFLLDSVVVKIKNYKKTEIVAFEGDELEGQSILVSGLLKAEMIFHNGQVIKIEDIESPRPIAPAFVFGKQNKFPVTVSALKDSQVLTIDKENLLKMLQLDKRLLRNYLNIISTKAQFLSNKIKFYSFNTIKGKLAYYFLEKLKEVESKEFKIDITQEKLADFFGVTRPSLSRALRELNASGEIYSKGKSITILNEKKLMDYVN